MRNYTDEELLKPHPELEKIFAKHGRPKPFLPTLETLPTYRKRLDAGSQRFLNSPFAQKALDVAGGKGPRWTETDIDIPVRDGTKITGRVYRPKDGKLGTQAGLGRPAMVFYHGGGWCMGSLLTSSFECRLLCLRLNVVVFDIAYRLYPDVPFPLPILDSFDATKWVAANAQCYGADLERGFIVAGNSGGATFATIVAHLARDEGLGTGAPGLTGQVLCCPILTDEVALDSSNLGNVTKLFPERYRSQEQNCDAPLQDRVTADRMAEIARVDHSSKMLTPFLFESHARLPPVYVQVCGLDPWRDGGLIYAEEVGRANKEGWEKCDVYPGLPHCWWSVYPMVSRTAQWAEDLVKGTEWVLKHSSGKTGNKARL